MEGKQASGQGILSILLNVGSGEVSVSFPVLRGFQWVMMLDDLSSLRHVP